MFPQILEESFILMTRTSKEKKELRGDGNRAESNRKCKNRIKILRQGEMPHPSNKRGMVFLKEFKMRNRTQVLRKQVNMAEISYKD